MLGGGWRRSKGTHLRVEMREFWDLVCSPGTTAKHKVYT